MKAEELMIGNYVYDNLGGTLKIKGISIESDLSHLKPIPLTEEWLVRFGFEKEEEIDEGGLCDYRYVLFKDNKTISFTSNWESEDEIYVNLNEVSVDVFYAHQLQNLYYTLTNEHLTIK